MGPNYSETPDDTLTELSQFKAQFKKDLYEIFDDRLCTYNQIKPTTDFREGLAVARSILKKILDEED